MKFSLMFKVDDLQDQLDGKAISTKDRKKAKEFAMKYVEYDGYLTVDFDTNDDSATVRETPV